MLAYVLKHSTLGGISLSDFLPAACQRLQTRLIYLAQVLHVLSKAVKLLLVSGALCQ